MFYAFGVVILTAVISLLLWTGAPVFTHEDEGFTSPLPDFLTVASNKQVRFLDLWMPFLGEAVGADGPLNNLTGKSILMYDLSTNKTIFERNARTRLPMASITKIMTAIIAIENPLPSDKYVVREEALVGENSMGLTDGEILSQEDLLYGLLLPSGNDAAEVLASNFPGGRAKFIQAMNQKAQSLGLTDTNFTNPSGLEGDGNQHTTAYDLLVITRYAIDTYPEFVKIVSTAEWEIPSTVNHKAYYLANDTNLITSYPGVKGVKTGFTNEAGMCLVTYLEYGGHRIIGILLNSEDRRQEMKDLLDYSLTELGTEPPEHE